MFSSNQRGKGQRVHKLIVAVLAISALSFYGCSGSGSTESEEIDFGENFVVGDAGSIRLVVSDMSLTVGQTSSFSVRARGADGSGASDVRITCDSEAGLAITEPTVVNAGAPGNASTGFTDGFGDFSGQIGCERDGSFRFVCSGANIRDAVSVRCEGGGSASFVGSAGGGLGGGVTDSEDDVDDNAAILLRRLRLDFGGEQGLVSVDINQDICDVDEETGDLTFEEFANESINVLVENRTDSRITFTSLEFTVPEASGSGTAAYNSGPIAFRLVVEAGPGDGDGATGEANIPIFLASGGEKRGAGIGFIFGRIEDRNVTIRLNGTDEQGDAFTITGSTLVNFINVDRCIM